MFANMIVLDQRVAALKSIVSGHRQSFDMSRHTHRKK